MASGAPTMTWRLAHLKLCEPKAWPAKSLVTGIDGIKLAIEGVRAGEIVATVSWDPYWQGSMSHC